MPMSWLLRRLGGFRIPLELLSGNEGRGGACGSSHPTLRASFAATATADSSARELRDRLGAAVLVATAVFAAAGAVNAVIIRLADFGHTLADTLEARLAVVAAVVRARLVDAAFDVAAEAGTADARAAIQVAFAFL